MKQPLVTIGIPVYNCERFIALAVKSVLKQSYSNFELIITDDGSTDNTLDELRKYNDPRITIISDGENHGISYRLNQQIDLAKGKYFCRMDADDIMFPERLERQVHYLESHSEVDVCGSSVVVIGDENEIIGIRGARDEESYECTSFIHPTVMGKLSFFTKYKYRVDLAGSEDADLWIRCRKDSVMMTLSTPALFYRDPLVFKLKTYLYRRKQSNKRIWQEYKEGYIPFSYYAKMRILSVIKTVLSCWCSWIGRDDILIKNRNMICSTEQMSYYSVTLNNIINNVI